MQSYATTLLCDVIFCMLTQQFHFYRSYTPIPKSYAPTSCSKETDPNFHLYLLIKTYVNGALTTYMTRDSPLAQDLSISCAKGNFKLCQVKEFKRIAVLAAGSGVTPFCSLLDYLLERRNNQMYVKRLNFI